MNDYSVVIFNEVRSAVQAEFPGCFCTTSQTTSDKPKLPALWMCFTFPSVDESTLDSSGEELWTPTVIDAQAYSGTSEREARQIIATADAALRRAGFRRTNYTQVPNADPSIRRIAAKWRAKANADGVIASW